MKQETEFKPRYMERSEAVIFGVGGYFQRRLAVVQKRKTEVWDLMDKKDRLRRRLKGANVLRQATAWLKYGDWLTDYESEQIRELKVSERDLSEIMTEVIREGRIDRAELEIRITIAGCLAYLNSFVRATDMAGKKLAEDNISLATEAIEALAILDPGTAGLLSEKLDRAVEHQAIWFGPGIV